MKTLLTAIIAAATIVAAAPVHAGPVCYTEGRYAALVTQGRDIGMPEQEAHDTAKDKSALIAMIYHDAQLKNFSPSDTQLIVQNQCVKKHGANW
ncbi:MULTISPECIES: hypothetical protein [unclassified Caballeronia]|uniref:hypothetical protein n=1 Tax=unclassified Caballeronia TaxID=2646786 RepID=UPI002027F0A2|nr:MULTISPECIES: hypothetical protein [unclassified Caballeronia]